MYNFNAFVGTVPAGAPDALDSDGLAGFTKGLKVDCAATPSLPASAADSVQATSAPSANSSLPSSTSTSAIVLTTSSLSSASVAVTSISSTQVPTYEAVAEVTIASTTVAGQAGAGGCTATVTASSQIFPTNCLGSGQIWSGGAGGPDCCDGATPCCR